MVTGAFVVDMPLWVIQGGFALESNYALLNDQLVLGLNGGIASGVEQAQEGLLIGRSSETTDGTDTTPIGFIGCIGGSLLAPAT